MCGRFTLRTPASDVAKEFGLIDVPELFPRYNIAPTQDVAAVRLDEAGGRELAMLRWGLVPSWADDSSIGNRMINARAETVAAKPAFRRAFAKRRCLIVADGFYEWAKEDGGKQPYLFTVDRGPFALAGLWELWRGVDSCAIITTTANGLMARFHERMPVILPRDGYAVWLDPEFADLDHLQSLLRPSPAEGMSAQPVSRVVNNPKNDVPECCETLGPQNPS
ncbi:MAG TPA: SOS response-associated peptidase [Pirellulales bacterium]|jgi:putative SOS response-associated peptidase YedK|nr:SOS response-associated peptidase [Pirellulales bacterium]